MPRRQTLLLALMLGPSLASCSAETTSEDNDEGEAPVLGQSGTGASAGTGAGGGGGDPSVIDAGGQAGNQDAGQPGLAIELTQLTVGDLTFDLRVAGPESGEPVILLHGFPQTSYEWRHQLSALAAAGYRAIAPDQRGYSPGARPEAVDDYAATLLVSDVLGIADALGIDRFHLVGHDWGASVVWLIGAFFPTRVLTLNPISVPHLDAFYMVRSDPSSCQYEASAYIGDLIETDSEDAFLENDAARLRSVFTGIPEQDIDIYVEALGTKAALGAAINWYRANLASDDPSITIGPVEVPTMYVWSDADTALCIDGAVLTEDFVSGPYRFEIIEGVSHWIPDLAPETLNALLLDHLAAYPAE